MYTLSLEILKKCNMDCTYCYLGKKKNDTMPFETAQKAIDLAAHEAVKQNDKIIKKLKVIPQNLFDIKIPPNVFLYRQLYPPPLE